MAKKSSMWSNPLFVLRVFMLEVSRLEGLAHRATNYGEPVVFSTPDEYLAHTAAFDGEVQEIREEIERTRVRLLQTKIADSVPDSWLLFPAFLPVTPSLPAKGMGHICVIDKPQMAVLHEVLGGIKALMMRLSAKEAAAQSARKGGEHNPGEADRLILAALCTYHKYLNCSVNNPDPIVARQLSNFAGVSPASVSDFWKRRFRRGDDNGSYAKYKAACNNDTLAFILGQLNGDIAPLDVLQASERKGDDDE